MEVDIAALLGPGGIYLIIFLALLVVLIIILSLINKNLEQKVIVREKEKEKENKLLKDIENLKVSKSPPKIALDSVNLIARNFFSENFNINKGLDYSEIIEIFEEKKNKEAVSFCEEMLEALYAGKKINEARISQIIANLENLIQSANPRMRAMQEKMILEMQKVAVQEQKEKEKEKPIELPVKASPPVIEPIKLNVAPVIKPTHLPYLTQKEPAKAKSEIEIDFKKSNEEQIRSAYKELQRKYNQVYEAATKNNQKDSVERLEKFREEIARIIEEYERDDLKIVELAQGISKGAKLLRTTGNL